MSAIFNFQSLLTVVLLLICTCAYIRSLAPRLLDKNKEGLIGIFWKCARIGERKSPYVAVCCVAMAFRIVTCELFLFNMTEKIQIEKNRILVGCTGSVASIKIPEIVTQLKNCKYETDIELIPTEHSIHFFEPLELPIKIHRDEDEWKLWQNRKDPVLHIELRRWADVMIIAPLDANTMGKLANGLCDNLLTCVVRAWDTQRPLLYAPAMNTYMWNHPLTATQMSTLKLFGYQEIPCIEKTLVCGDTGFGAMAEVSTIVSRVCKTLEEINGICID